jgi:hypothetical protein
MGVPRVVGERLGKGWEAALDSTQAHERSETARAEREGRGKQAKPT